MAYDGRSMEHEPYDVLNAPASANGYRERSMSEDDHNPLLQSLDYDNYMDQVSQVAVAHDKWQTYRVTGLHMLMTLLVAFVTAMFGYILGKTLESLTEFKLHVVTGLLGSGYHAGAYFTQIGLACLFTLVATAMTIFLSPKASGGGFPYVTAYLNGTYVASFFSWRIVLVKMAALIFAIAGGLPLGMESPYIFIGAGVAMNLVVLGRKMLGRYGRQALTIKEERNIMAAGAAAGLAVAFSAPLAGVLIVIDQATAFVTTTFTVRIFVCAMFAQLFSDLSHSNFSGSIDNHNLVVDKGTPHPWAFVEIFAYILLGIMGALIGALGIWANMKIVNWRFNRLPVRKWRENILLMAVLTAAIATAWFTIPFVAGCRPVHDECFGKVPHTRCEQLHCAEGYYSDIGTILYSSPDHMMRVLLDRSLSLSHDLRSWPLLFFALLYFAFACVVYGAPVPGGLFVPSIIVGGCYGRVMGVFIASYMPGAANINPGVYALLGAGSMLGGFNRQALPIVVMLMELTGDATYLLPLMITSILAKSLGDMMTDAMYTQHMAFERIPILGEKLPPSIENVRVKDILRPCTVSVEMIDKVVNVLDVLKHTNAVVIPVSENGQFAGMVMRKAIVYALTRTRFYESRDDAIQEQKFISTFYPTRDLAGLSAAGDSSDLLRVPEVNPQHLHSFVNLTPYVDAGCFSAQLETPTQRVQALFRRVGTSHLAVTDQWNKVLGVITRGDLLKPRPDHPIRLPLVSYADGPGEFELERIVTHASEPTSSSSSASSLALAPRSPPHPPQQQRRRSAGGTIYASLRDVNLSTDEAAEAFQSPSAEQLPASHSSPHLPPAAPSSASSSFRRLSNSSIQVNINPSSTSTPPLGPLSSTPSRRRPSLAGTAASSPAALPPPPQHQAASATFDFSTASSAASSSYAPTMSGSASSINEMDLPVLGRAGSSSGNSSVLHLSTSALLDNADSLSPFASTRSHDSSSSSSSSASPHSHSHSPVPSPSSPHGTRQTHAQSFDDDAYMPSSL